MVILVIAGLVMAIVAVLFAFENAAVVTINFGTWEFEQSLATERNYWEITEVTRKTF